MRRGYKPLEKITRQPPRGGINCVTGENRARGKEIRPGTDRKLGQHPQLGDGGMNIEMTVFNGKIVECILRSGFLVERKVNFVLF